jgi:hypothetical protein
MSGASPNEGSSASSFRAIASLQQERLAPCHGGGNWAGRSRLSVGRQPFRVGGRVLAGSWGRG